MATPTPAPTSPSAEAQGEASLTTHADEQHSIAAQPPAPQQAQDQPAPAATTLPEPQAEAEAETTIQPAGQPEVDFNETDSTFGDDGASTAASTSLASSVLHYEYSNGRRYHAFRSGAYVLPNDDEEQDRLDFTHHVFLMILDGKLHEVPLPHAPSRVLDIGTGTGIWSIDFGDANPGSEIVGTDLSPIQPSWVPPNVKFYVDDCESDWVYPPSEHFDFVHTRELIGSISDWPRLLSQAYANMTPNGWIELQEPGGIFESADESLPADSDIMKWQNAINEAADGWGKPIKVAHLLKERMLNAGFVDVHEHIFKAPLGPWAKDPKLKEVGRYHRERIAQGIIPYTLGFFGKVKGWSEDECNIFAAKVLKDLRNPKIHMYLRYHFVYGRKPAAT